MIRPLVAATAFLIGSAQGLAAQGFGSVTGFVRESAGSPLAGAEVTLDNKSTTTNSLGGFRLDSLAVGNHIITIRLPGYAPLRSPIVVRAGVWQYNFVLSPAAQQLPTIYAEAGRSGIYGTIGDTSYQPLAGVRVHVAGRGGGEAVTDSSGRFAFPAAVRGQYVVRAARPGYSDERLFVELDKGEGVELAIRLRPSLTPPARADEVAIQDLGRRLAVNLPGDRINAGELNRYGTMPLCDVSRIAGRIRRASDSLTIIVNGTSVLEGRSVRDLCAWQAAEVELLEYGESVCRDDSQPRGPVERMVHEVQRIWGRGSEQDQNPAPGRTVCGDMGTKVAKH